ncbi:uncharacterized protein [Pleurodeles waltl]|uniref:uncharacterized protein n=1 Tax=Pleurodeles waltl TaxID=8319 RepID=UPI00370941F1
MGLYGTTSYEQTFILLNSLQIVFRDLISTVLWRMSSASVDSSWLRTDESLQLRGRLKTPQLTSTTLRGNRKPAEQPEALLQEEEEDEETDISARGSESDFAESQSWLGTQRLRQLTTLTSDGQLHSVSSGHLREHPKYPERQTPATPARKSSILSQGSQQMPPETPVNESQPRQLRSKKQTPSTPASDYRIRLLGPQPQTPASPASSSRETLSSGINRLRLMEEDEDDELIIQEDDTSEESEGQPGIDMPKTSTKHLLEEHLPDLLDSAILDSDEDF